MKTTTRIYRNYTDASNYEGCEAENVGRDLVLTWRAAGTGYRRIPRGEVVGNKVLVFADPRPEGPNYAEGPDASVTIVGAAGKDIEFGVVQ